MAGLLYMVPSYKLDSETLSQEQSRLGRWFRKSALSEDHAGEAEMGAPGQPNQRALSSVTSPASENKDGNTWNTGLHTHAHMHAHSKLKRAGQVHASLARSVWLAHPLLFNPQHNRKMKNSCLVKKKFSQRQIGGVVQQ